MNEWKLSLLNLPLSVSHQRDFKWTRLPPWIIQGRPRARRPIVLAADSESQSETDPVMDDDRKLDTDPEESVPKEQTWSLC